MPRFGDPTPVAFSQGLTDNPNVVTMENGELQMATGGEYRLGDSILHKTLGRSANTSTGLGSAILGMKRLQYNNGTDVFVALAADGDLYEATPGSAMTFTNVMQTEQFNGSGLDDLTLGGDYSGTVFARFEVMIDGTGTPDTFKWRKNRGAWNVLVNITGGAQTLQESITVTFGATTGHTLNEYWIITILPTFSTTVAPTFTSFRDTWLMATTGEVYVRESASVPLSASPWRPAGMPAPGGVPIVTVLATAQANKVPDDSGTGDMVNPANTIDSDSETYGDMLVNVDDTSNTHTWTFSSQLTLNTNRVLTFEHKGVTSEQNRPKTRFAENVYNLFYEDGQYGNISNGWGQWTLDYSYDAGTTWTDLYTSFGAGYGSRVDQLFIADSVDLSSTPLLVRYTVTWSKGTSASGYVYKTYVHTGKTTAAQIKNAIWYGITEVYIDSNSVEHESPMQAPSNAVAPGADTDIYGITLSLVNQELIRPYAQYRRIYRSLDEGNGDGLVETTAGGYPDMWAIADVPVEQTFFLDDLETKSLSSAFDKIKLLSTQNILFPDGASTSIEMNRPPPDADFIFTYQGSICYLPTTANSQDKLYFSEPFAIRAAGAEAVPREYYLRFETPQQDSITSAAVCNGGKSCIVYFGSSTSLVNYLPQASDPGRFDQRVRETVSKKRGTAGKHTTTSFSPDEGVTEFAASVDSIGLWITDGIGMLKNWSKDINWATHFGSATLSTGQLVDNPFLRRLEFYFDSDGAGAWQRMCFFYGELKHNGMPKITGPDAALVRTVDWAYDGSAWAGWSGSTEAAGHIFNENTGNLDAALSNGVDNKMNFVTQTKDFMPYKMNHAAFVQFAHLLWDNPTSNKDVTVLATLTTEPKQAQRTSSRTYDVKASSTMMVMKYGDRINLKITDNSNTALPGLVGAELVSRRLTGAGNDKAGTV